MNRLLLLILAATLFALPAFAQGQGASADSSLYSAEMSHADSVDAWVKDTRDRTTVDRIGETTSDIVFFPLRIVFTGAKEAVGLVNEEQLVAKADDFLSSDDGRWRVVPVASNRTGAGAKLKYKPNPIGGNTHAYLLGSWWLYGRQRYELVLRDLIVNHDLTVSAHASYGILPEERFYGFGMHADEDGRLFYKREDADVGLSFGAIESGSSRVRLYGGLRVHNVHRASEEPDLIDRTGELVDSMQAVLDERFGPYGITINLRQPGDIRDRLQMGYGGLRYDLNTAANPARPQAGTVAALDLSFASEVNGRPFGYLRGHLQIGQYIGLGAGRLLYGDIETTLTRTADERGIPFYSYPSLGGSDNLRGFVRDRFRGEHLLAGTVEYRFPLRDIWGESGLDFVVFTDWGRVFIEDLPEDDDVGAAVGYGFGLAGWNIEGGLVRVDFGFSREGMQVYLTMGL